MKMSDEVTDYREATLLLKKMGLHVSTESITSDLYDVGHVISSAPEAGNSKLETALCCTSARAQAASGSPCRTSGKTEKRACGGNRGGILIGDVSYEESEDYGKDFVADQSIPSGSQANKTR